MLKKLDKLDKSLTGRLFFIFGFFCTSFVFGCIYVFFIKNMSYNITSVLEVFIWGIEMLFLIFGSLYILMYITQNKKHSPYNVDKYGSV